MAPAAPEDDHFCIDKETNQKVKVTFNEDARMKLKIIQQESLLFILKNTTSPNLFKECGDVRVKRVSSKICMKFEKSINYNFFLQRSLPSEFNTLAKLSKAEKKDRSKFKKFTYQNGGGHWSLFVKGKKDDLENLGGKFMFEVRPKNMRRRGPPAYLLAFQELVDLFRFWVNPVSDMFDVVEFKVF